jgi:hypothetical protein
MRTVFQLLYYKSYKKFSSYDQKTELIILVPETGKKDINIIILLLLLCHEFHKLLIKWENQLIYIFDVYLIIINF